MIRGRATEAGTAAYATRFAEAAPGHFRRLAGLHVSSVGIGTGGVTGEAGAAAGAREAVEAALRRGFNVIDTADSYGHGAAEAAAGAALAAALESGAAAREEVVVCSKAGYLVEPTNDGAAALVDEGLCEPGDFTRAAHCIAPGYLRHAIESSRRRLGTETIDLLLLHNPEDQLIEFGRPVFEERMRAAFEALEEAAESGAIGAYGVASAEGLRTEGDALHRLDRLVEIAEKVGGDGNRLRCVELPLNILATEALFLANHSLGGRPATALEVAAELGVDVLASLAVNRGCLPAPMPRALSDSSPQIEDDLLLALQFTRSCPGVAVALVGMTRVEHVESNAGLLAVPPADLLRRA